MERNSYKESNRGALLNSDYWKVSKKITLVSGLEQAILLADLTSKEQYFEKKGQLTEDGCFFNTQENIKTDLGLSEDKQRKYVKELVELKFISTERRGIPAKIYYKINHDEVGKVLSYSLEKLKNTVYRSCEIQELHLVKSKRNKNKDLNKNKDEEIPSKEGIEDSLESSNDNSSNPPYKKEIPLQGRRGQSVSRREKIVIKRHPAAPPPPEKKSIPIPEELILWNGLGLVKHGTNTRQFVDIVETVKKLKVGTYFNKIKDHEKYKGVKFTQEQITASMKRFAIAAIDPDYLPINKRYLRGMPFTSFFHSPFSMGSTAKSCFIEYLENEPKLCGDIVNPKEDESPHITRKMMRLYCEEILGGRNTLTQWQKNKFITASEMLKRFVITNGKEFAYPIGVGDVAEMLHRALAEEFVGKISPGNYCSEYSYNVTLPKYMERQACFVAR